MYPYRKLTKLLLALVITGQVLTHGAQETESSQSKQEYQQRLISDMQHLRPGAYSYYDYGGPWVEEQFFNHFVANPELNKKLHRVFIPMCITDALYKKMRGHVEIALKKLDRQYKYFIVVQLNRGLGMRHILVPVNMPHDLDIVAFMAGGSSVSDFIRHTVPIPLLAKEYQPSSPPLVKTHNVMFQGRSVTHWSRGRFEKEYKNTYSILQMNDTNLGWVQAIEQSNFTFAPRGVGETSYRMYHALQLGSIPIYIWQGERFLPYEELIDWCDIAVVMSPKQMMNGGLKRKIDSIQDKVPQMQENIAKVRHMFTYNFTMHYIVDTLIERFNPDPNRFHE